MDGRLAPLVVAGLALLLLPPAEASPVGFLESSRVSVAPGALAGEPAFAAWEAEAPPSAPASLNQESLVNPPGFSLSVARAEVTIHHANWTAGVEDEVPPPPTHLQLSDAVATGGIGDAEDARLIVLPLSPGAATLAADGWALDVTAAASDARDFKNRVPDAPDLLLDTRSALQVAPAGDGLVRVTGSFRLVVNGLDLDFATSDGPQTVHTRFNYDVKVAAPTVSDVTYGARYSTHEAVLDLHGATLVLPVTEVALRSATLHSDGAWSFEGAAGTIQVPSGPQPVSGPVQMEGALTAHLLRNGGRVGSTLDGSLSGLLVDGQPVAIPPTAAVGSPKAPLAGGLLLPIVVGAVLAAAAHVATGRLRFRRLDRALDRREYHRALTLANRFRLHPWMKQDAALAAALSLMELGRPDEARERLLGEPRWSAARLGIRDFLLARAAARRGDRGEATRRLAASLLADRALMAEALADPALSEVLGSGGPDGEAYA